jgi:hypothetical protein
VLIGVASAVSDRARDSNLDMNAVSADSHGQNLLLHIAKRSGAVFDFAVPSEAI